MEIFSRPELGGCANAPVMDRLADLLPVRAGNSDDDTLAPAAMAAFERRPHQMNIADAFEAVVGAANLVGAALSHVDEVRHQLAHAAADPADAANLERNP